MTSKRMVDAWYDESITDPTELLVFMAICDEADERGFSHPRVQDIMIKGRCSERTAHRKIKDLLDHQKIECTKRHGTSNEYKIIEGAKLAPSPDKKGVPQSQSLPANLAPHSISSIKELSINKGNTISETEMPRQVVKGFNPDEVEQPKKRKIKTPNNRVDLLEPKTKGERILFGTLQAEIIKLHGPNWRGIPKRFPSFACKEAFAECESRLNGELTKAINAGVQKGIREIDNLVKYTHAIAFKEDKEQATSADLIAAGYKL
jgi:hypothetical protein